METYTYEPLEPGNFRTLFLSPGDINDPLQGSLKIFSLAEPPEYFAISYTWGEEVFPHKLHLSGGYLRITTSLYGALRQFRDQEVTVRVWADQVCIAQHDLVEKNHQVDSIADIYRQADEVLVWLGEAQESDCDAHWTLKFLTHFLEHERISIEGGMPMFDLRSNQRLPAAFDAYKAGGMSGRGACCTYNTGPVDLESALQSLNESIWTKPWFERLWVVQEVAVARTATLQFGYHAFTFQDFHHIVLIPLDAVTLGHIHMQKNEVRLLERCERIVSLEHAYRSRAPHEEQHLLDALVCTHGLFAREEHDRIYALRALACVETIEGLKPNYETPISRLRIQATIVILTALSTWNTEPDILCEPPASYLALAGTQRSQSDPSWVPNVTYFTEQSFKTHNRWMQDARYFLAGSAASFEVVHKSNVPNVVRLRGIFACRVSRICPESRLDARLARDERNSDERDIDAPEHTAHQYEAYYHFVCREASAKYSRVDRESFCDLMRQGMSCWKVSGKNARKSLPISIGSHEVDKIALTDSSPAHNFFKLLVTAVPTDDIDLTRVLASTTTGHVCWIPCTSQTGDIVCIFQGAPFPFVIRARDDGYFTLLGDAYVQGIMHGEAWPQTKDSTYMIGLR